MFIEIVMATNHNLVTNKTERLIYAKIQTKRTKLGGTANILAPTKNEFSFFVGAIFNLLLRKTAQIIF